ncbi:hypothetical protein [Mycolicibacterium brumae]|uniref:hypothetical protein n=1 Tax=Mycolicibacterium brumae TaxID=85968 RepID=UPI000ADE4615|nr:hypothetical protein [Mycolicibacterium brumae]MCV7191769.1 hypothetical protein [Mycolicibacterium brumae]UWW07075.1 hypothetical protein L2Z93_000063 [Mycolicibacterium brumae]
MATQPFGPGGPGSSGSFQAPSPLYNRSYVPAAVRAGIIALVLAALLLIVIL